MTFLFSLYFSVLLTTLLVPPFMRIGSRFGMIDVPDARKVHSRIIPRTGGIAVIIGTLIPLVFHLKMDAVVLGICLGGCCIFVLGVLDDARDLDYKWKFFGQIVAALLTLCVGGLRFHSLGELWPGCELQCGVLSVPLSILFLVATINIINLADGLDGLAGGICMLIFTSTGFLAYLQSDYATAAICMCILGAIMGFLRYNTHPAVVFLGDTGSLFLGFMVGVVMILLTQGKSSYSPILAMYLIGIPVLDTAVVMLERHLEHRPLFKPDKSHLHHKLMRLGLKHHHAVIAIYATQLGVILIGWNLRHYSDATLLGIYVLLMGVFSVLLINWGKWAKRASAGLVPVDEVQHGISDKTNRLLTRDFISKVAWYALVASFLIFYAVTPFLARFANKDMGLFFIIFLLVIVLTGAIKPDFLSLVLRVAAYYVGLYYIIAIDNNSKTLLIVNWIEWAVNVGIFLIIGASYLCYILTTFERIPIVGTDYLLLGIVVLTYFLPEWQLEEFHVHRLATKILIIFLTFELLLFKLKDKISYLVSSMVFILIVNFVLIFWPWII